MTGDGQNVSRAQRWFRGERRRPWLRWYFAAFCIFEVVATVLAVRDGYWMAWVSGPGILVFAIFAVLA